jgi:hypothetical protein
MVFSGHLFVDENCDYQNVVRKTREDWNYCVEKSIFFAFIWLCKNVFSKRAKLPNGHYLRYGDQSMLAFSQWIMKKKRKSRDLEQRLRHAVEMYQQRGHKKEIIAILEWKKTYSENVVPYIFHSYSIWCNKHKRDIDYN